MHNKIIFIKRLSIIIFLMSHICTYSMEVNTYKPNLFLTLPNKTMPSIIGNRQELLKDNIKTALSLKSTCKDLHARLSWKIIGQSCVLYDKTEKNEVMKKWLNSVNDINYWKKRNVASILIYAGADNNSCAYCSLLYTAIHREDNDMITILFENNINPNQISLLSEPDFFSIKKVEIAKIFIAKGVDLNTGTSEKPNGLWSLILHYPSPELVKLYLHHNVDVKKIDACTGCCILHQLVTCAGISSYNIKDYIRVGELLFNAAPEMIYIKNKDGETPLDLAQVYLNNLYLTRSKEKTLKALIPFFKKCEATQERKQDNILSDTKDEHIKCIICYEVTQNMRNIPCPHKHPDVICVDCYKQALKFSEKCPLCQTSLL